MNMGNNVLGPAPKRTKDKYYKIHSKKNFINKSFNHSDASIWSQITITKSNDYIDSYVSLKIRDCDRTVNLSLGCSTDNELNNSIYKINTMIVHLSKLKEAITKAGTKVKELKTK